MQRTPGEVSRRSTTPTAAVLHHLVINPMLNVPCKIKTTIRCVESRISRILRQLGVRKDSCWRLDGRDRLRLALSLGFSLVL